jgi:hypothetical protein
MKKIILLIAVTLIVSASVTAQKPQATNVLIEKQNVPGYTLIVPDMSTAVLAGAVQDRFETVGKLKSSKVSGFTAYLNQNFPEFGTLNYDMYVKVEVEGKKKNNTAKLTFAATKGNYNPITPTADPEITAQITRFLEEFVGYAQTYNVKVNIEAMKKELAKQEKALKSLNKEKEKQEKALNSTNGDIKKTQEVIDKLQLDINQASTSIQ